MATVTCVDGRVLGISPVPVLDRDGVPYEVTLDLTLDGDDFGTVGERCGYFLAAAAVRVVAARADGAAQAARWPDPADRFPASNLEGGLAAWARDAGEDPDRAWAALTRYVPRDHELFAFRHRDPDDLASTGELRVTVHTERVWVPAAVGDRGPVGRGAWRLGRRASLEAWGSAGVGVRALLDSAGLVALLTEVVADAALVGAHYPLDDDAAALRRPAG